MDPRVKPGGDAAASSNGRDKTKRPGVAPGLSL
jgi:hypothetical protein